MAIALLRLCCGSHVASAPVAQRFDVPPASSTPASPLHRAIAGSTPNPRNGSNRSLHMTVGHATTHRDESSLPAIIGKGHVLGQPVPSDKLAAYAEDPIEALGRLSQSGRFITEPGVLLPLRRGAVHPQPTFSRASSDTNSLHSSVLSPIASRDRHPLCRQHSVESVASEASTLALPATSPPPVRPQLPRARSCWDLGKME
eukprot:TRINITY_DN20439_c0_g1_i1.p1 TRINITY_DN20439_c0_g1~~TRINITY_DN20439_c0_g1_i1.p1  ORF type:complete len:219 (-),score=20.61 TRINITY_DN20439_c0_g1_i1:898-1500(-)